MSVERDPYFAGRAIEDKPDQITARVGPLLGGWIVVFCLNLIVPLMLASKVNPKPGKVGMTLAILGLMAAGGFVVSRYRRLGVALVIGGSVVAALQVVPCLQFIAGALGLATAHIIERPGKDVDFDSVTSETGGFVATLVTGSLLILAGLALGLLIRWTRSVRPREPGEAALPAPEWR